MVGVGIQGHTRWRSYFPYTMMYVCVYDDRSMSVCVYLVYVQSRCDHSTGALDRACRGLTCMCLWWQVSITEAVCMMIFCIYVLEGIMCVVLEVQDGVARGEVYVCHGSVLMQQWSGEHQTWMNQCTDDYRSYDCKGICFEVCRWSMCNLVGWFAVCVEHLCTRW